MNKLQISEKKRYIVGTILLVAAAVLIIAGIRNGETAVVLRKAIRICLECIGIG